MRVALLSYHAPIHSAVGGQLAERAACFAERGDEARLFVQSDERLHPGLACCTHVVAQPAASGPAWDYLAGCDLVVVAGARASALTQWLPLLAGQGGPRVVLLYHGVEPEAGSPTQRGLAWCGDDVVADNDLLADELNEATDFPREHIATLSPDFEQQDGQDGRARFAACLEALLAKPRRPYRDDLGLQALGAHPRVAWGARMVQVPVRLFNWGSHAALADGPGATVVQAEVSELRSGQALACAPAATLPGLLMPGRSLAMVLSIPVPEQPGQYRVALWTERPGAAVKAPFRQYLSLAVEAHGDVVPPGCASTYLDAVQQILPAARRLQSLPNDYADPAVGLLGRIKRRIKRKLVNTFKFYYVDVLARQQTQVNTQLVVAVQQLAECCATLDLANRGLQRRIDQLETKLNDAVLPQHDTAPSEPILEDAA